MRVNVNDITQSMTLKVQVVGLQRFKFRLWVGTRLLCLAAWVIGIEIEIKT